MTIEQANQYFAALPDGFASTEQLRAAFTAPVQKVQFVGVAGTAGKTVTARLLAAILHAQGIHAGLYHAGCRPLSERICIDDAPVDEGLLALTADALSAAEALPHDAAELAVSTMQEIWSPRNAARQFLQLVGDLENGRECSVMEGPGSKE